MRHWDESEDRKARIEIIPMIDVMMFLLVFFVLLSLNVIPALGIKTALPSSSAAKDLKTQHIARITLAVSGEMQLEGVAVTPDRLVPGLKALEAKEPDKKLVIIVNADQKLEFQHVIDLMDSLKGNGFESISFATKRK